MTAKAGILHVPGKKYRARIWRPSMNSTIKSERFFGSEGESNCETISWVWGTEKTG
jgi:hypothetical protein